MKSVLRSRSSLLLGDQAQQIRGESGVEVFENVVLLHCSLLLARLDIGDAERVLAESAGRVELHQLAQRLNRFRRATLLHIDERQIVEGVGESRFDLERLLVGLDCFFKLGRVQNRAR